MFIEALEIAPIELPVKAIDSTKNETNYSITFISKPPHFWIKYATNPNLSGSHAPQ
jgi:hypothetical protein